MTVARWLYRASCSIARSLLRFQRATVFSNFLILLIPPPSLCVWGQVCHVNLANHLSYRTLSQPKGVTLLPCARSYGQVKGSASRALGLWQQPRWGMRDDSSSEIGLVQAHVIHSMFLMRLVCQDQGCSLHTCSFDLESCSCSRSCFLGPTFSLHANGKWINILALHWECIWFKHTWNCIH